MDRIEFARGALIDAEQRLAEAQEALEDATEMYNEAVVDLDESRMDFAKGWIDEAESEVVNAATALEDAETTYWEEVDAETDEIIEDLAEEEMYNRLSEMGLDIT